MKAIKLASWFAVGAMTAQLLLYPADAARAQALRSAEALAVSEQVSVNKATIDELQVVKGIGPSLAERIVEYREANGKFSSLEELKAIRGIGDAKFERIKAQIKL